MLHFSRISDTCCNDYFLDISKKILSMIPILAGIIVGYIYALIVGIVDFTPVLKANWFEMPEFIVPFVSYKVKVTWDILLVNGTSRSGNHFRTYRPSVNP